MYIFYLILGRKPKPTLSHRRKCDLILNVKDKQKNLYIIWTTVSDIIKALTLAAKELTSCSDLWSLLVKRKFCSRHICSSSSIRLMCCSADFFSALNKRGICEIFGAGLSLAIHLYGSSDLQILLTFHTTTICKNTSTLVNNTFPYSKGLIFYSETTTILINTACTESHTSKGRDNLTQLEGSTYCYQL